MKHFIPRHIFLLAAMAACLLASAVDLPIKTVKGKDVYYYKVNNNESVYGISKRLGIPREDIIRHNPSVADGAKRGMMLYFPVEEYTVAEEVVVPEEIVADTIVAADTIEIEARTPSIALLLPLGLGKEEPTRENRYALDFYKGFLLGTDTLRERRSKLDIYVFDTEEVSVTPASMLSRPEIHDADIVVTPPNPQWLAAAADSAKANDNYAFNIFVIQDSLYLTNARVLQGNTPQKTMYKLAADALMGQYESYTPVIIRNTAGRNEKEAFVSYVTERYAQTGIVPIVVEYENNLMMSELDILPVDNGERYVIIPTSGALAEFNRFAYVVKSFRDRLLAEATDEFGMSNDEKSRIEVFGYPDWTAFRGDALETLHSIEATVYSRFNDTFNNFAFRNIEEEFERWYGTDIIESVPCQALLGYDTACLLIRNLLVNDGKFNPTYPQRYEGVQSTFDFEKTSEGFCNASLYILTYKHGGRIEARTL